MLLQVMLGSIRPWNEDRQLNDSGFVVSEVALKLVQAARTRFGITAPVPGARLLLIHVVVASHRPPGRLMATAACREEFLLQFAVARLRRPSEMEYQAWRTVGCRNLYTQFCCLGPCHVLPKHADAILFASHCLNSGLYFLLCSTSLCVVTCDSEGTADAARARAP